MMFLSTDAILTEIPNLEVPMANTRPFKKFTEVAMRIVLPKHTSIIMVDPLVLIGLVFSIISLVKSKVSSSQITKKEIVSIVAKKDNSQPTYAPLSLAIEKVMVDATTNKD